LLCVVQGWRVTSAGYARLVSLCATGLALLAWMADGRDVWLLPIGAVCGLLAVVPSVLAAKGAPPPPHLPPPTEGMPRRAQTLFEVSAALATGMAAALLGAGSSEPAWMGVLRALTGAALLGSVTDAMILGHWYLIDPKLPKDAIRRLGMISGAALAADFVAVTVPPSSVLGAGGASPGLVAGWAITTVFCAVLVFAVSRALRERGYAAVMSATGLLYVAVMVAFGVVVTARLAV
jgi:hypothetical protein